MKWYRWAITIFKVEVDADKLEAERNYPHNLEFYALAINLDGKRYAFTYDELKAMLEAWEAEKKA